MAFGSPVNLSDDFVNAQVQQFPASRYMGSKQAIIPFLHEVLSGLEFTTALDAFSGSGAVSYLLKAMNKSVTSNDFLAFAYHTANACVANGQVTLDEDEVEHLLSPYNSAPNFVETTFQGLYFTDEENRMLDNLTAHIRAMNTGYKQSIAYAALARACLRKRPRGLFTYTGVRYQDGRRDLQTSFTDHFRDAVTRFNQAVFDNCQSCHAYHQDAFTLPTDAHYDLVYFDTPYVSNHSDNDYTRRYHFVEGLVRYWDGLEILPKTLTKKFKRLPSLFDSKQTVNQGFARLFERYSDSTIVVSYGSNGIPAKAEMMELLEKVKPGRVTVFEKNHRYMFGTHAHKVGSNENQVSEYLFVAR